MKRLPLAVVLVALGILLQSGSRGRLTLTTVVEAQKAEREPTQSDAAIRAQIIRLSLASYSGNCPCPYNTDRAGRSCGKRSAYSRPGGASPLCYPGDVSQRMVDAYRTTTAQRASTARKTK